MTEQVIQIRNIETGEIFTTPKVLEHNLETSEIVERDMNQEEIAVYVAELEAEQARIDALAQAQIQRQALLEKLGITEEEAKLLLS